MSKHDDDTCPHLVRASLLEAENARLKAEVERLKEGNDCLDKMHEKEMERSAYLCEEVNRTTAWGRGLESDLSHARVEISFLKAENERLKKPAIIGGYNISEYIRMANSETLEFDNGDIFADMTLPERIKYIVESHARLKAEVQRLRASSFVTAVPVEQYETLKAEFERLTADNRQLTKAFEIAEGIIKRMGKAAENAAKEGKPSA